MGCGRGRGCGVHYLLGKPLRLKMALTNWQYARDLRFFPLPLPPFCSFLPQVKIRKHVTSQNAKISNQKWKAPKTSQTVEKFEELSHPRGRMGEV